MQALVEAQETFSRRLSVPAGLVVETIVQVLPFQDSAKVSPSCLPTALHEEDEAQETPSSSAEPVSGLAVVWIDQVLPL